MRTSRNTKDATTAHDIAMGAARLAHAEAHAYAYDAKNAANHAADAKLLNDLAAADHDFGIAMDAADDAYNTACGFTSSNAAA